MRLELHVLFLLSSRTSGGKKSEKPRIHDPTDIYRDTTYRRYMIHIRFLNHGAHGVFYRAIREFIIGVLVPDGL